MTTLVRAEGGVSTWLQTKARLVDGWPGALFVLTAVHLVTFSNHYRGLTEVPWDFPMTYYAMAAYWTTAVGHGVLPEWVPYQQMGYPLMMNLQTGIGYLPLWFFPLTGQHYTLHSAMVFQDLHVLWGAIGAWALGRTVFGRGLAAWFVALAYHFFGGFYSNAQHVDIVRAYAWVPWLFWCLYFRPGQERLEARNVAIPAVVWLMITGSYPGNIAAHLFVGGLSLVGHFLLKSRPALGLLPRALVLMVAGILMSAPVLYPAWAFKDQLVRAAGPVPVQGPWTSENWLYLFVPWHWDWPHQGDMSMGSALIPLVTLVFLGMLRRKTAVESAAWIISAVACLAMLPGDFSWLARALKAVFPFMGYSRFPSSDYRAPMALSLVLLGGASFHAALQDGVAEARARFVSTIWVPLLAAFVFATGQFGWALPLPLVGVVCATLAASVVALFLAFSAGRRAQLIGRVGLLVVVAASGYWTVTDSAFTWSEDVKGWFQQGLGYAPEAPAPIGAVFTNPAAVRPPRQDTEDLVNFSWRGYLDGSYQMHELTGSQFAAQARIFGDPELFAWMQRGWEERLLPADAAPTPESCELLQVRIAEAGPDPVMSSVRYGVNEVLYQVRLPAPALVVENEMFFRGWKGTIVQGGQAASTVEPESVCGGLRAWRLPAGEYELQTRFETPHLRLAVAISASVVFLYLAWVGLLSWARARDRASAPGAVPT